MALVQTPVVNVSRPALQLPGALGYGRPSVAFKEFEEAAGRPRATISRHLKELSDAGLILHVGYDEYAIPSRQTFARLLVEPSGYARSLLLHQEVLGLRREETWAFCCLPVRRVLEVELPHAIPVLRPDDRLRERSGPPYPKALWYRYSKNDAEVRPLSLDPEGGVTGKVPTLRPDLALALLAATLDARILPAAQRAAQRLGVPWTTVLDRARGLFPETTPLRAIHPNTVVFPDWLQAFWESATRQQARLVLGRTPQRTGSHGQGA